MKTTVALVFALVILLPHSANAKTLTITGGRADLHDYVGSANFRSTFGGPGFSVLYTMNHMFFGLTGCVRC